MSPAPARKPTSSGKSRDQSQDILEDLAPMLLLVALVLGSIALFHRAWPTVHERIDSTVATVKAKVGKAPSIPDADDARSLLDGLPVRSPVKSGYEREKFGQAWADVDHNGCDTRNDVLTRDLADVERRKGSKCVVIAGTLEKDPYTGKRIVFVKAKASAIQIDHVVALSEAWQSGAGKWTAAKRLQIANDPLNLLAVDGPTNQTKSDKDPAHWLPKKDACKYLARYVAVKKKYALTVDPLEAVAIGRKLVSCG